MEQQNYLEYSEPYDTISNGHRIAIKTEISIIKDLFFVEYIEPILVVKRNKRKKKYDISNAEILIYKIDETKEFIHNIKNYLEKNNIDSMVNKESIINKESIANEKESMENDNSINNEVENMENEDSIKENMENEEDSINNEVENIEENIINELLNNIIKKIEIQELVAKFI